MALLKANGEPLSTEAEWLGFFKDQMKFPEMSSAKYAKYLVDQGFTGDVLQSCIDDADVKMSLGMLLGEYKKLQLYIKSSLSQSLASSSSCSRNSGPISKIPRPTVKMDSTQLEFDQFLFEWDKYKCHYNLRGDEATTNLFFCCPEDVRQHIRTRQSRINSQYKWEESGILNLIKDIVTSRVSPIVHVQEFSRMKQNSGKNARNFLED